MERDRERGVNELMISERPFNEFKTQCRNAIEEALHTLLPEAKYAVVRLVEPPSPEMGELGSSIAFELSKIIGEKPNVTAEKIANSIDAERFPLIESAIPIRGYVNFRMQYPAFASMTIRSVRELNETYGYVKEEKTLRIIVEHTSVNPIHPIHIGQARNPILGDSLSRLLSSRGHNVKRHYYVDDVGRQSAVIAYAYSKLGKPKSNLKPDHFIGILYAITSCLLEISKLRKSGEKKAEKLLEDWLSVAEDLKKRFPDLFKKIEDLISKEENFEEEIRALIRKYEEGEREVKELIREISNSCLEGFKETLSRIGVEIDSWDWESEFIWNGSVAKVIEKLKETPYVFWREGVLEFDAEKTAKEFNLKGKLGLEESYEIPSLTLVRADGTTLYTTRDIAYSIWKLSRADKVINVVGMEQRLAQLQMKLALYALGMGDLAQNLIHFAYNLVRLPGYRMSSRRGRYITLDEVIDEAINRAYKEVSKRSPHLPEEEKRKISEVVGIGAIRFFLVSVDPAKPVTFTWDKVLDFERNSAPYIQYTHSRATSILRKTDESPSQPNLSLLSSNVERRIVWTLSKFPEAVIEGSENLKPNLIADYILNLADLFNSFYNSTPVLHAENIELRNARLALVESVRIVLRNGLNLLGIEAPERM